MKINRRQILTVVFGALVAFAPSGTRYIFRMGEIAGHPIEPGTVSVFGMAIVAVIFVTIAFAAYGWREFYALRKNHAALAAVLLAALAIVSALHADDVVASLAAAAYLALGVAVFLTMLVFRPNPHEALGSFVGGAVFQTVLGGYQFLTQSSFASKWLGMASHSADQLGAFVVETDTGRWLRAYGSLAHPNVYGLYVGLGLLACVGLAAFRGHGKHLRFYAFMPLIAAGLLFSFSRGAILAVAAGFVWMAVSAYTSDAAPTYRTIIAPSFIIIAATFAVLGGFYAEPLMTRATAQGRLEARSIADREGFIGDAVLLFEDHSLGGVGMGRMPFAVRREIDPNRAWWEYDYVHDVPMLVAVETGAIGLLAWLAFVGFTFAAMVDRLSRKAAASTGVTVYAAAFIALVISSLFDHFLWSSWIGQILFWIIAGLLHAAYLDLKKRA